MCLPFKIIFLFILSDFVKKRWNLSILGNGFYSELPSIFKHHCFYLSTIVIEGCFQATGSYWNYRQVSCDQDPWSGIYQGAQYVVVESSSFGLCFVSCWNEIALFAKSNNFKLLRGWSHTRDILGMSAMEFVDRLCNTGLCSIQDGFLRNGLVPNFCFCVVLFSDYGGRSRKFCVRWG